MCYVKWLVQLYSCCGKLKPPPGCSVSKESAGNAEDAGPVPE